jgi:hypothetical protein
MTLSHLIHLGSNHLCVQLGPRRRQLITIKAGKNSANCREAAKEAKAQGGREPASCQTTGNGQSQSEYTRLRGGSFLIPL